MFRIYREFKNRQAKANMKISLSFFCLIISADIWGQTNGNHVYVAPYTRGNGVSVQGHYRTAPNSSNTDNFSTLPNMNPYTGKPGYIAPDNKSLHSNYPSYPANSPNLFVPDNTNQSPVILDLLNYSGQNFSNNPLTLYPSYKVKITANLREQMSVRSAVLANIPKGTIVTVSNSFFGDWWEIEYAGITGYVHSSLLSFYSGQSNFPIISNNITGLNNYSYSPDNDIYSFYPTYYTKLNANLREQMSITSAILIKIPKGALVKVRNSFFDDWWEISYGGITGYIASSLLRQ